MQKIDYFLLESPEPFPESFFSASDLNVASDLERREHPGHAELVGMGPPSHAPDPRDCNHSNMLHRLLSVCLCLLNTIPFLLYLKINETSRWFSSLFYTD